MLLRTGSAQEEQGRATLHCSSSQQITILGIPWNITL